MDQKTRDEIRMLLLLAACFGAGLGVLVYRLMEHWPFDSHCSAGCG